MSSTEREIPAMRKSRKWLRAYKGKKMITSIRALGGKERRKQRKSFGQHSPEDMGSDSIFR